MQNFGRGMWRRVGDYQRIHVPLIHKNYELERYLALMEYNKQLRVQNLNTHYQQKIPIRTNIVSNTDLLVQQTNNNKTIPISSVNVKEEDVSNEEEVAKEEEVVSNDEVAKEEVVSIPELTNIVPKKSKKKNKK